MSQTARCPGCETVTMPPAGPGHLYLSPPVPHTRKKIIEAARAVGLETDEGTEGIVGITVGAGTMSSLLARLGAELSDPEREECNGLFLDEGEALTLSGLLQARSLDVMIGRAEGQWLVSLMEEQRLSAHFHPIVAMQGDNETFAHECLLRGRGEDGELISPARLFGAARRADLLFHLDRAARLTAIHDAMDQELPGRIFINFNPTAIYDPVFCLQTTVRAVQDAGIDPSRLVFEVIESDEVEDSDHLLNILNFYRKAGFGVALDDLGSGYASLNLLTALRPDFVKFDRELIEGIDSNPYKQKVFAKLAEMARDLDVRTVAEGIETEAEWDFLKSHDVDFAQGFLLCKPDSPPQAPRIPGHPV